MIAVFLSFVTSDSPTVKMIGLGLAVAVAVDATIVRLMLVPATMELLGNANWWLPKPLEKLLPHINVEGTPSPAPQSGAAVRRARARARQRLIPSRTDFGVTYAPLRGLNDAKTSLGGSDGAELELGRLGAAEPGLVQPG